MGKTRTGSQLQGSRAFNALLRCGPQPSPGIWGLRWEPSPGHLQHPSSLQPNPSLHQNPQHLLGWYLVTLSPTKCFSPLAQAGAASPSKFRAGRGVWGLPGSLTLPAAVKEGVGQAPCYQPSPSGGWQKGAEKGFGQLGLLRG